MSSILLALLLPTMFLFPFSVGAPPEKPIPQVARADADEFPISSPVKEDEVITTREENIQYAKDVSRARNIDGVLFLRIMLRESDASSTRVGDTTNADGSPKICKDKSSADYGQTVYARGCWQITRCYHPEVSDEQAFDCKWSTDWAADVFKQGRVEAWSTLWLVSPTTTRIYGTTTQK